MTDPEIKLKCLELAMEQSRREGTHGDRSSIAEITTVFYNLTQGTGIAPAAEPKPQTGQPVGGRSRKPGADKSVFD